MRRLTTLECLSQSSFRRFNISYNQGLQLWSVIDPEGEIPEVRLPDDGLTKVEVTPLYPSSPDMRVSRLLFERYSREDLSHLAQRSPQMKGYQPVSYRRIFVFEDKRPFQPFPTRNLTPEDLQRDRLIKDLLTNGTLRVHDAVETECVAPPVSHATREPRPSDASSIGTAGLRPN